MKTLVLLFACALVSGCSTHPITGRDQMLAVPALQIVYADAGFVLADGMRRMAAPPSCEADCNRVEARAELAGRVALIGAELQSAARSLSPELTERIGGFKVELSDSLGIGSGSSAGGRIVLGSGLSELEPTDVAIAFLIAREMAHVIARHDEENSGASILVSALGYLLPGVGLVALAGRFIVTSLGAGALQRSWAAQQRSEADAIAIMLLERTGTTAAVAATELVDGINRSRLPDDDWGLRYLESAQRVAQTAETSRRVGAQLANQLPK
jgi:Zn-dependent protease with chaperone function